MKPYHKYCGTGYSNDNNDDNDDADDDNDNPGDSDGDGSGDLEESEEKRECQECGNEMILSECDTCHMCKGPICTLCYNYRTDWQPTTNCAICSYCVMVTHSYGGYNGPPYGSDCPSECAL
eukprot:CAMPEP_0114667300 /NCGR_PEP_ID=MMETSP0191-20121206/34117_1 /TAXON_ID=126664 /ORGANISM="Sorites sp." /LENGTH=120 /DNA_ID=CAMNT_0001917199 /DNA_START=292 /DNA_END=654 /DNA_ORIENTATION=+